ncbi:hypothetical protein C7967_1022 [Thalassospira sp. 11-3]|jgi:hypothetical protein|nr:hypothetical protein KO164_1069 [Thalassospira sp. KO164]PXX33949.1 hypothetical protein C7967_1022 [Thalassospira sp. 11-3]SED87741.1 hypothetical protein SAMN04515623_1075 [Thalassospira permensis]|tara:strand:+ start:877 stop:1521 length:645 start_codon:yes stop_codon:yes gene_type:complete
MHCILNYVQTNTRLCIVKVLIINANEYRLMTEFTHLEDQIRECFGRVIYTHKTHEKMAERYSTKLRRLKISQIVISAIIASGICSTLFFDQTYLKAATAILSLLGVVLSGYLKGIDPGGIAQAHRDTAKEIWPIRESYLSLLTDLRCAKIPREEAAKWRDELQEKLAAIYQAAPQTEAEAYADAQKALKDNEDYTFSDEEIDMFVPKSLRKTDL